MSATGGVSDRDIFTELYPRLRSFAGVVGDDDMEPEDIVQDVLVATLRRTTLAELDDPGAYLRQGIINRVISTRRALGVRRDFQPLLEQSVHRSVSETYPVELGDLLPKDSIDRAVLWLTAIEGMTSKEAAVALDLSSAAVRKRLSRIRSNQNRKAKQKGSSYDRNRPT